MKTIGRREFLKTAIVAGGAVGAAGIIPGAWLGCSRAVSPGFFESEFGITDALCRKVLDRALSKGGDFADLYFEHTISNYVGLEDGKVDRTYGNIDLGVGIRTVKGDQTGYGFTQELTEASMLKAASTAAGIADAEAGASARAFVRPVIEDYYPLARLLSDVSLASKLPIMKRVNERSFNLSDLVIKVKVTFHDQQKRVLIFTSDGVRTDDLLPLDFILCSVVAEREGRQEKAYWEYGGRHEFSYYATDLADRLAEETVSRAITLFDAVQPPAGEMPVVLGPGITGILLHEAIGHGMEADLNRKGLSTYATMIGKKVAEPFVNIIDDGTNERRTGSINVDDEGTVSQRTTLVEKGVLTGYLHDRISARHYNVNSTGNGRRESYQYYPMPRMRNTYMLAGDARPEDIIKSVKKGIYVKDMSNGQVKIGEGDFAFYVSQGSMIEDGKITGPIKDVNIMGNGPKMLQNITMVGDDLEMCQGGAGRCGKEGQAVPISFGLPTCLVNSLTVGGVQKQGA